MIRQISTEVRIGHHFVDEGKWVVTSRVNAKERDNIRVGELTSYPGLLKESLGTLSVLSQPHGPCKTHNADLCWIKIELRVRVTAERLHRDGQILERPLPHFGGTPKGKGSCVCDPDIVRP